MALLLPLFFLDLKKVFMVSGVGHTLTPEGMKIDDRKVEAIKQMSAPKDKKGL